MTPFHNMALICADTSEKDVDHHTAVSYIHIILIRIGFQGSS